MQDVYITGMSVMSSISAGSDVFWQALLKGESGVGPVTRFDTSWLPIHIAAEIKDFYALGNIRDAEKKELSPVATLGLSTARAALDQAGLLDAAGKNRFPEMDLLMASIHGDLNEYLTQCKKYWETNNTAEIKDIVKDTMVNNITFGFLNQMARRLGMTGYHGMNTNACAASGYAISLGVERIRQGKTALALCGGAEVLAEADYSGFCSLRALAAEACQPFDRDRRGLIIGEGCGVLVLESGESVKQRGIIPLAKIAGYGWSADAHHLSAPHPEGWGTRQSIVLALEDAQLEPKAIGGIIAHGTGTPGNDRTEANAFADVFGKQAIPVTAPKSMLGHTMGAASVIEAIIGILSLIHQTLPPTIHHYHTDSGCPIDVVAGKPRALQSRFCLTNSSGFGGNNDSLIFALP
ncbi:beta-ketoacyl-[acyl-carrier-protein] synthase family protein [bacterium]|nr:beta-ketoacyl-[acyl-carrier-protein] synthase family protein [bacterium]